jgi:sulfide:quinone oxidoreductase
MDARRISAGLSVSPQITKADIAALCEQGFRTIICNRPDGEEDGQPAFSDIEAAAEAQGMTARYLPIVPGQLNDADASAFRRMLGELPGPVLAYCRSGTRSAMLWALAMAEVKPLTDILAATQGAGYDVSGLIPRLATRIAPNASPARG